MTREQLAKAHGMTVPQIDAIDRKLRVWWVCLMPLWLTLGAVFVVCGVIFGVGSAVAWTAKNGMDGSLQVRNKIGGWIYRHYGLKVGSIYR